MVDSIEELLVAFITLTIYLAITYFLILLMNKVFFLMEFLWSQTYIY